MAILLIAAEAREFDGVRARLGRGRKLGWPIDFSRVIQCAGQEWLLVANGPGPALARQAATVSMGRALVQKIVNVGFCGGLDPGLAVGDVFVASEVRRPGSRDCYPASLPKASRRFTHGSLMSVDRVVVSPAERAGLWEGGSRVVEMEAAGVAHWASEQRLPFYCVRAVSDTGGETLPLDFNLLRRPDGRFSKGRIVGRALCRPRTLLPELLRLNRQATAAALSLGEFLVDCEF